jgi:hypothetical protein
MRVSSARARMVSATCLSLGVMCAARCGTAQEPSRTLQPEVRADVIAARTAAAEFGVGAVVPTGEYMRLGGDLGLGVVTGGGHGARVAARIDAYGRIHLDPFAEYRWAPYLFGGGSYLVDPRSRGRLAVLAGVGVEGPPSRRLVPAFELGLGGGVRLGFAIRRGKGQGIRG